MSGEPRVWRWCARVRAAWTSRRSTRAAQHPVALLAPSPVGLDRSPPCASRPRCKAMIVTRDASVSSRLCAGCTWLARRWLHEKPSYADNDDGMAGMPGAPDKRSASLATPSRGRSRSPPALLGGRRAPTAADGATWRDGPTTEEARVLLVPLRPRPHVGGACGALDSRGRQGA